MNSCNSKSSSNQKKSAISEQETLFTGKWKLVQEKMDGSSDIELNIEKAGYFEINTILNDPKFAKAGIDKIQPISKGQWKIESKKLMLTKNIGQNSPKTDVFKIKSISSKKMELISKKKNLITYIK
jgi:hypothetical protein